MVRKTGSLKCCRHGGCLFADKDAAVVNLHEQAIQHKSGRHAKDKVRSRPHAPLAPPFLITALPPVKEIPSACVVSPE